MDNTIAVEQASYLQELVAKVQSFYAELDSATERITIDFVSDDDSIESSIAVTTDEYGLINASINTSSSALRELTLGVSQYLERYNTLLGIVQRRQEHLDSLMKVKRRTVPALSPVEETDPVEMQIMEQYGSYLNMFSGEEQQQKLNELKAMIGGK